MSTIQSALSLTIWSARLVGRVFDLDHSLLSTLLVDSSCRLSLSWLFMSSTVGSQSDQSAASSLQLLALSQPNNRLLPQKGHIPNTFNWFNIKISRLITCSDHSRPVYRPTIQVKVGCFQYVGCWWYHGITWCHPVENYVSANPS